MLSSKSNLSDWPIWATIHTGKFNWIYSHRTIFEAACLSKDLYSMTYPHNGQRDMKSEIVIKIRIHSLFDNLLFGFSFTMEQFAIFHSDFFAF